MSWMSPTTSSGRLFQTCTAAWMNVLPEETVLELGIVRAWQGMETLERVALRMTYGCGSKAFRSGGHKLVCILYKTNLLSVTFFRAGAAFQCWQQ